MTRLISWLVVFPMPALLAQAALPPPLVTPVVSVDWPAWRGDGTGITSAKNVPDSWGVNYNVRWKLDMPGYGWSCPVVAGDKVFITTATSDKQEAPLRNGPPSGVEPPDAYFQWKLLCLDRASGKM